MRALSRRPCIQHFFHAFAYGPTLSYLIAAPESQTSAGHIMTPHFWKLAGDYRKQLVHAQITIKLLHSAIGIGLRHFLAGMLVISYSTSRRISLDNRKFCCVWYVKIRAQNQSSNHATRISTKIFTRQQLCNKNLFSRNEVKSIFCYIVASAWIRGDRRAVTYSQWCNEVTLTSTDQLTIIDLITIFNGYHCQQQFRAPKPNIAFSDDSRRYSHLAQIFSRGMTWINCLSLVTINRLSAAFQWRRVSDFNHLPQLMAVVWN